MAVRSGATLSRETAKLGVASQLTAGDALSLLAVASLTPLLTSLLVGCVAGGSRD